jgi:hypothetical protein
VSFDRIREACSHRRYGAPVRDAIDRADLPGRLKSAAVERSGQVERPVTVLLVPDGVQE